MILLIAFSFVFGALAVWYLMRAMADHTRRSVLLASGYAFATLLLVVLLAVTA